jgi:hypothetical protein
MIALNSSGKLRADASVADKVDYTIHGVTGDVITQLADGQLAAAEANIFQAVNDGTIVTTIIFVNTHTSAITCNLYLQLGGGVSRRIIPKDMAIGIGHVLTFDGVNLAVTNQQGNVVFYEEGDTAATPSGYAHLMRQADNTLTVPLIDSDRHPQVDIVGLPSDVTAEEDAAAGKGILLQGEEGPTGLRRNLKTDSSGTLKVEEENASDMASDISHIEEGYKTEDSALGRGVLLQGDDGTDRHNVAVDASGNVMVEHDAFSDIEIGITSIDDNLKADGNTLGKGFLVQGDDGTDRKNIAVDPATGNVQINVVSQPADTFAAEGSALGKGVLLQGDDGVDRHNLYVDPTSGSLKVNFSNAIPAGNNTIGKLAANSGVDIGDVDIKSLPNKLATWTQVVVNIYEAITTELIQASAGHTYTILTISLTIAAANNLTFRSATTAKTGPMDFGGSGEAHEWQANFWPVGIKCAAGEALNLTTTTTGQVSGVICVLDES